MWRFFAIAFITAVLNLAKAADINTVNAISIISSDKSETIQIDLEDDLGELPKNFFVASSHKIVIDLDNTSSLLKKSLTLQSKLVPAVNVIVTDERTRVILNLTQDIGYDVKVIDHRILIEFAVVQPTITFLSSAEELITSIREHAKTQDHLKEAIEEINSLLLMPPNQFSEEAQDTAGQIYERLGQPEKAKAEDRAFIAMYPDSPLLARVRQRLIALEIAAPAASIDKSEARKPRQGNDSTIDGSISEYLYYSDISENGGPTNPNQVVALTNARMNGMWRENEHVTKLVIRNTTMTNILTPGADRNTLQLAYVDFDNTFTDNQFRIGRQNSVVGMMGRYDGVSSSIGLDSDTRLKFAAGTPFVSSSQTERQAYGIGYEKSYPNGWSSTYYLNYQLADNFPEREAFGAEAYYFKDGTSMTLVVEYDALYHALNTLMWHASLDYGRVSPYVLVDIRKSPVLFAERALMLGISSPSGVAYNTVGAAVSQSNMSSDSIYDFVNKATPYNNTLVLGTTGTLTQKWNINTNVQVTNVTETTDTSFVATPENPVSVIQTPGSGNIYSLNFQLFGNDVRTKGNSVSAVLSLSQEPTGGSSVLTLLDGETFKTFRVDTQVSYMKREQMGIKMDVLNSSVKLNYKINNVSSIESQLGIIKTTIDDNGSVTSYLNNVFFIGWKYDF